MSGNSIGAHKAKIINIANNPRHYNEAGVKGGTAYHEVRGFQANRELASAAGRIGGYISRKNHHVPSAVWLKEHAKEIQVAYERLQAVKEAARLEREGK